MGKQYIPWKLSERHLEPYPPTAFSVVDGVTSEKYYLAPYGEFKDQSRAELQAFCLTEMMLSVHIRPVYSPSHEIMYSDELMQKVSLKTKAIQPIWF